MAADYGIILVDAIIEEGQLGPVYSSGVTPDMLSVSAASGLRAIFNFADQPTTKVLVPPREFVETRSAIVEWPYATRDARPELAALCQTVKQEFIARQMSVVLGEASKLAADRPYEALTEAMKQLNELQMLAADNHHVVDVTDTLVDDVCSYIGRLHDGGGRVGVPWPWEQLTDATKGMQPGELIVFYGVPKSMKTWLALYIVLYGYMHYNAKAMIYSSEVVDEAFKLRIASILGRIPYDDLRGGFAGDPDATASALYALSQIREEERAAGQGQRLMLIQGILSEGGNPLSILEQAIESHNPDVVMIDSAYLLTSDLDWKTISKFAREAKQLAVKGRCCVIITSQENVKSAMQAAANRRNPGQGTVSYSQGLIENCDIAIRVIKKTRGRRNQLSLHVTAGREIQLEGITINGNPGHDFAFVSNRLIQMEEAMGDEETGTRRSRPVAQTNVVDRLDEQMNQWQPPNDGESGS